MNVELLEKVRKHILEEPKRVSNQGTRAYARVVSARIKHFIKTEGRE